MVISEKKSAQCQVYKAVFDNNKINNWPAVADLANCDIIVM